MSSSRDVSGICAAVTLWPFAFSWRMTLFQQEPSAQAPCTKRIFAFFIGPPCGLFVQGLSRGFAQGTSRGIVGGVIGVTASIERIERAAVIRRERKFFADTS